METTGQTMGLDETLNGLNATSEDNGIDVHMILPTEYGAVAILSASGYGNPGKLLDESDSLKRTSTGNSSGVFFTGERWEVLASYGSGKYIRKSNVQPGNCSTFAGGNVWHIGTITPASIPSIAFGYGGGDYRLNRTGVGTDRAMISGGQGLFATSGICYDAPYHASFPEWAWNRGDTVFASRGSAC